MSAPFTLALFSLLHALFGSGSTEAVTTSPRMVITQLEHGKSHVRAQQKAFLRILDQNLNGHVEIDGRKFSTSKDRQREFQLLMQASPAVISIKAGDGETRRVAISSGDVYLVAIHKTQEANAPHTADAAPATGAPQVTAPPQDAKPTQTPEDIGRDLRNSTTEQAELQKHRQQLETARLNADAVKIQHTLSLAALKKLQTRLLHEKELLNAVLQSIKPHPDLGITDSIKNVRTVAENEFQKVIDQLTLNESDQNAVRRHLDKANADFDRIQNEISTAERGLKALEERIRDLREQLKRQ